MTDTVIAVRDLGKRYRLGETLTGDLLQTRIGDRLKRLIWPAKDKSTTEREGEFWALQDVAFEVQEGEVLGVIGRNGAGKSTLLKILSRITEPSAGEVRLRGRVASLLEVGTGFHKELTGRENVYLNGAILGMSRREIRAKFDEIVQFAGVEQFIDTPVKRYSTGMTVRLAFAVAAHLEPEILLVDEVLAVGDADFQKRCLGKMDDAAKAGRTILFVSHNMAAVEGLCDSCLILENGRVRNRGLPRQMIGEYLGEATMASGDVDLTCAPRPVATLTPALRRFRILGLDDEVVAGIDLGGTATLQVSGRTESRLDQVTLNIRLDGHLGERVTVFHTLYQYPDSINLHGAFILRCRVEDCRLMPGTYSATIILKSGGRPLDEVGPIPIEVFPRDAYGTGRALPPRIGSYVPRVRWQVEQSSDGVGS
jgi:lipopolysaccharide transport system ATP-binding protein